MGNYVIRDGWEMFHVSGVADLPFGQLVPPSAEYEAKEIVLYKCRPSSPSYPLLNISVTLDLATPLVTEAFCLHLLPSIRPSTSSVHSTALAPNIAIMHVSTILYGIAFLQGAMASPLGDPAVDVEPRAIEPEGLETRDIEPRAPALGGFPFPKFPALKRSKLMMKTFG